jgi:hypothetical protein
MNRDRDPCTRQNLSREIGSVVVLTSVNDHTSTLFPLPPMGQTRKHDATEYFSM